MISPYGTEGPAGSGAGATLGVSGSGYGTSSGSILAITDRSQMISPPLRSAKPDLYYVEPYVLPGNVDGPESPHFGRGGWTWYTGAAGWNYRVALNYILGVRPVVDGLIIDPVIPKAWDGFKMKRFFRNAFYEISVKNPNHVSCGVRFIKVNGKKIDGLLIPPQKEKGTHRVEVALG